MRASNSPVRRSKSYFCHINVLFFHNRCFFSLVDSNDVYYHNSGIRQHFFVVSKQAEIYLKILLQFYYICLIYIVMLHFFSHLWAFYENMLDIIAFFLSLGSLFYTQSCNPINRFWMIFTIAPFLMAYGIN